MTHNPLPPVPPSPDRPDDLDRLFSAYFKPQLPARWPDPPTARATEPAGLRRPSTPDSRRSRLTLAASVAALFGLGLAVSSGSRPEPNAAAKPDEGRLLPGATANGKDLLDRMKTPMQP
jgi:hypothetical protein